MDIDEIRRINIKRLESEAGSASEIANRVGMSYAQYVNTRDGAKDSKTGKSRGMRKETAWRFEDAFNKPRGWLDQQHEESNVSDALIRGRVPLISWIQAGNWAEVINNLSPGKGERIETSYRAKEHTYALRVRGDSMEPKFPEGAILIVEPEDDPTPGKFVIIRQNGDTEATFKQLIQDGGIMYLKPLNTRYPIMELRDDAVFCGVVRRVEMDV